MKGWQDTIMGETKGQILREGTQYKIDYTTKTIVKPKKGHKNA